jgi:zinc transporter ZupT
MAPALVYFAAEKSCSSFTLLSNGSVVTAASQESASDSDKKLDSGMVWLYSFISIAVITLFAAFGIFFVPFVFKHAVLGDLVMTFMIALASSVLAGEAILHLLPEIFAKEEEHGSGDNTNAWIASVVMGGIYLFWLFEKFLHARLHPHHNHRVAPEHVHDHHPIVRETENDDIESGETEANPNQHQYGLLEELKHAKPVAILIIMGDAFHNFVDGLTIGAAFVVSGRLGLSTAIAVLLV